MSSSVSTSEGVPPATTRPSFMSDQGQQLRLVLDVQVVGGFVQQEFTRLLGQGAGDLHALALAAGQGVPGLPGAVGESGARQCLAYGLLVPRCRPGPGGAVPGTERGCLSVPAGRRAGQRLG